ncbi:STE24 endopeptidase [Humibacillus xanthopallidus]|uniref:STE24 endopeptidase n=1 Tax=Humibacillus xanthopallidus TaxID=412689 RepID=A0A543PNC8_9MICO|nr:M48 family metallopeptidase [Humibacillus xanthopallidus]TQN45585.1 STE24 endopeptidase [Humibacillus xanthopallidus]
MTPKEWAQVALVALAIGLAVAATMLVPWRVPRPSRAARAAALRDVPADVVTRGRALHAALRPSAYGSRVVGLAAVLLLGLTPAGARIVAWVAQPFGGHWLAEAVLGGLVVLMLTWLASLPFGAWRHTVLRDYGLSTQDWRGWTVDLLKSGALGIVTGAVVLAGFYTLTRVAPDWWWALAAATAAALVVLLSFVVPVLVEPVFNRFTPMPAGSLRDELAALAAKDGMPVRDVLVADASRRTTGLNAYVSGFGTTRRIVVYDTLLQKAPAGEVRSVVAHELGHAKDRDPEIGTVLGAIGAAAAVVAIYLLGQWDSLLDRAGVDSIASPRAIGLVLALGALAGLVTGPLQSLVSRRVEVRADQHALRLTGDPAEFAAMQLRLATVNIADVDPPRIEYLLFATHPDTVERLAAAKEAAGAHASGLLASDPGPLSSPDS